MSGQAMTVVFLILVVNQVLATVTFGLCYGIGSNWWSTPVGRHLMFYTIAAGAIDMSWLLLATVKQPWLMYVLFTTMLTLGLLTWQRVWLVIKVQRRRETHDHGEGDL